MEDKRETEKNKICLLFEIRIEIYTVRFNRWNRYRNISGSKERIREDSHRRDPSIAGIFIVFA